MLVDSTCLARLVAEAADYAVGLPVRRIVQPRHDLVALELGRSGPWDCLLIDWSPEFGRLHLAHELPASATSCAACCGGRASRPSSRSTSTG